MDKRVCIRNKWGGEHETYISWDDRPHMPIDQNVYVTRVSCGCVRCGYGHYFPITVHPNEMMEGPEAVVPYVKASLRLGMEAIERSFSGMMCDKKLVHRYMKHKNKEWYRNRYLYAVSNVLLDYGKRAGAMRSFGKINQEESE